jgi:hypothetical protein
MPIQGTLHFRLGLSFIHKYGSCLVFLNPKRRSDSAKCSWNLAAAVFSPYNDLLMIRFFPHKIAPNSGPAVMLCSPFLWSFRTKRHFQYHMHSRGVHTFLLRKTQFEWYPCVHHLNKCLLFHLLSNFLPPLILLCDLGVRG